MPWPGIIIEMSNRLPLDVPKQWGMTDAELVAWPLAFREDLLAGQVCLVSGGGSGMGRAIAYVLTRLGATVAICGRRLDKLEETAAGIRQHLGKTVMTKAMTIRDPEQVKVLFEEVWQRHGRLDALVNSAGGQFPQAAIDFSVKGWNAVIDTNLNGSWYMMQAAAQHWSAAKIGGSIVNIGTAGTRAPVAGGTLYLSTKGAVDVITVSLAKELGPRKIRVNQINPGGTETEGAHAAGIIGSPFEKMMVDKTPLGRLGQPGDIGPVAVFLASDDAAWVTGELLHASGGA